MNLYEFIATSRSGHHAIIDWTIKNLCGEHYPEIGKFKEIPKHNLCFIIMFLILYTLGLYPP